MSTEILFYHLQTQPLERVLPTLLQRSRERGCTVVVEASSPERVSALDDHLWSYADDAFMPHGTDQEADAASQPILLMTGAANPNGAAIRFCVDGTRMPEDVAGYERVVLMFDGDDPDALAQAREDWKRLKTAGQAASYMQQDENGRWEKKA
ncbi:MAG: DNA polymerase III subunit chi [Bosea sp. (in: a-proteobacteria)]